jgi:hypothetical protein
VGDALTETGTTARTKAGSWRGDCPTPGWRPCRAPSGGSPRGAPPPAGRAAPLPQVGGPRRNAASMVTPAKGLARPPYLASSYRPRSQSRALPAVASPRRWAQAPTLEQRSCPARPSAPIALRVSEDCRGHTASGEHDGEGEPDCGVDAGWPGRAGPVGAVCGSGSAAPVAVIKIGHAPVMGLKLPVDVGCACTGHGRSSVPFDEAGARRPARLLTACTAFGGNANWAGGPTLVRTAGARTVQ